MGGASELDSDRAPGPQLSVVIAGFGEVAREVESPQQQQLLLQGGRWRGPCCGTSWCVSPRSACLGAGIYLLAVALLNLLCWANYRSPLYGATANLSTGLGVAVVLLLATAYAAWWYNAELAQGAARWRREGARGVAPSRRAASRCACLMSAYLLASVPAFFAAKLLCYPGYALELAWEERPAELEGEELYFASTYDGAKLHAYRAVLSRAGPGVDKSALERVVPVLFLGGNGGSSWANVREADKLVRLGYAADAGLGFDVYSFSYRGYAPNDRFSVLDTRESIIIADSASLLALVRARYPGQRVLLFAHSMGTGAASALGGELARGAELACLGLATPFASLVQTALEAGGYAPTLWAWTIDSFRSADRVASMDPDVPLCVLSGGKDGTIAPHHQREVFERAASRRKELLLAADAGHMDYLDMVLENRERYIRFLLDACLPRALPG
jgi:pimeloyl-ACP methyl ester carboxylesterase